MSLFLNPQLQRHMFPDIQDVMINFTKCPFNSVSLANKVLCKASPKMKATLASANVAVIDGRLQGHLFIKFAPIVFINKGLVVHINRPFPNYLGPLFQSESWCSSFHMKICFHLHVTEN